MKVVHSSNMRMLFGFNYYGDDGDKEIDSEDGQICSFIVKECKKNIFKIASACKIYNCNGKHNTGYHFSLNSCPKYKQIRKNDGEFNIRNKIIALLPLLSNVFSVT